MNKLTLLMVTALASMASMAQDITFYAPNIVRVQKFPTSERVAKQDLVVTMQPGKVSVAEKETTTNIIYKSAELTVTVDKESGRVSFADIKGNALLAEGDYAFAKRESGLDAGSYEVTQAWLTDPSECLYGLGLWQNGKMSQRGFTKHMVQGNTEDMSPVLHSSRGWAIYWDNYSPTTYDDSSEGVTSFSSQVGEQLDYYFMYGGDADGVVACMRQLTGDVPMMPLWSYGFWQSRERYKTAQELLDVVRKYRELQVPLDGIVQDWQYWGSHYLWNAMDFLGEGFAGTDMIDQAHRLNTHMIITVWANFGPQTLQYREMKPKGMLLDFLTWPASGVEAMWPPNMDYPSGVRPYDAYNAEARDIYWKYLKKGLYDKGMDGWWLDSTEPDHLYAKDEDFEQMTAMGSLRRVRNAFPLMTVGGVYDHQRAETSDKRVFILTRCAYTGQQRYGANLWSGDVSSSWQTLRAQVPALLNLGMTGYPHSNTDIGGFFCGAYNKSWNDGSACQNPAYRELYTRWLQYGTFNPMMRSHGCEAPREIYQFGKKGEPIYDAIEKFIRLRYQLMPYIYSTSWEVTARRGTFMRPLVMDFAQDPNALDCNTEFLFGRSILVAPVLQAQYTTEATNTVDEMSGWDRGEGQASDLAADVDFTTVKSSQVYLPAGTQWWDFWTDNKLQGGQTVTRETTIDMIPLYVRAGSILPLGPDVQYIAEKPWDNLELRVYPGADGQFTLYEDEGDSYRYEQGQYTEIPLTWNDKARTLTIGARQGSYPGMLTERKFTVTLPTGDARVIKYSGKRTAVKF